MALPLIRRGSGRCLLIAHGHATPRNGSARRAEMTQTATWVSLGVHPVEGQIARRRLSWCLMFFECLLPKCLDSDYDSDSTSFDLVEGPFRSFSVSQQASGRYEPGF